MKVDNELELLMEVRNLLERMQKIEKSIEELKLTCSILATDIKYLENEGKSGYPGYN